MQLSPRLSVGEPEALPQQLIKESRLQKLRDCLFIAFSALTLSVGHQEEHPAYVKIE